MKRIVKQSIIVFTLLFVIGSLFWFFGWIFETKPTCFDGLKNGAEDGIDCGTACEKSCPRERPKAEKIKVTNFEVIKGGNNKCDLVATVENPNNSLVGQHIPYSFKWGDNIIKKGEFYIYPSEKRYLAEFNLTCQEDYEPEFDVKETEDWEFFRNFTKPDLQISDFKLNYLEGPNEFAEVNGKLINRSAFDLKTVEVFVLVKDANENLLAINQTTINSILTGQVRDFRIFWTHSFETGGTPSFYVTTNLFDSQNFIKQLETDSTKSQEKKDWVY